MCVSFSFSFTIYYSGLNSPFEPLYMFGSFLNVAQLSRLLNIACGTKIKHVAAAQCYCTVPDCRPIKTQKNLLVLAKGQAASLDLNVGFS